MRCERDCVQREKLVNSRTMLMTLPIEKDKAAMGFLDALNSIISSPDSDFILDAIPLVPMLCMVRPLLEKARPMTPLQEEKVHFISDLTFYPSHQCPS